MKRANGARTDLHGPDQIEEQFNERYVYGDYSDAAEPRQAPEHALEETA